MVQATDQRAVTRALALESVQDPRNVEVVDALSGLLGTLHRLRLFTEHGAAAKQLLLHLANHAPVRGSGCAHAMNLDQSTISRQLAHLAEAGLVERTVDPDDRRAQVIDLTPAGRAFVREAFSRRVASFEAVIDEWSAQDRTEFARLLNQFTRDFEARATEGEHQ